MNNLKIIKNNLKIIKNNLNIWRTYWRSWKKIQKYSIKIQRKSRIWRNIEEYLVEDLEELSENLKEFMVVRTSLSNFIFLEIENLRIWVNQVMKLWLDFYIYMVNKYSHTRSLFLSKQCTWRIMWGLKPRNIEAKIPQVIFLIRITFRTPF